jgi:hypothetical protein
VAKVLLDAVILHVMVSSFESALLAVFKSNYSMQNVFIAESDLMCATIPTAESNSFNALLSPSINVSTPERNPTCANVAERYVALV